jgi:hypothetical protein
MMFKTRVGIPGKTGVSTYGMKDFGLLLLGLSLCAVGNVNASGAPRGTVFELHSCELYAGGCVVSSEEPMDGRYMFQAWNFSGGDFRGVSFAGLKLAVLQASTANLAAENTGADRAVIYIAEQASAAQREALVSWVKENMPEIKNVHVETRLVPLQFEKTAVGYQFSAGKYVVVNTDYLESSDKGNCGVWLGFCPRPPSKTLTGAVKPSSRVEEPLLELKWNDAGKRSIFLAKFGDNGPAKNVFVTAADLCGPTGNIF